MYKKSKKKIAAALVAMLAFTAIPMTGFSEAKAAETTATPVIATNGEISIYKTNDCEVTFKVTSKWGNSFEGNIIVKNLSTQPLENWRVKFNFDNEITGIWDGVKESHEGNEYVLKYPVWNQSIAPGAKATIGFNATTKGDINAPTNCGVTENGIPYNTSMPNEVVQAATTDYETTFRTSSDWGDAFVGEIAIKNKTDKDIEGWNIEFDFDREIKSNLWNAKIVKHEGNHYVIKNDGWNSVIKPGKTVKFGFEGSKGNVLVGPTNYAMYKVQAGNEVEVLDTEEKQVKDAFNKLAIGYSGTDSAVSVTNSLNLVTKGKNGTTVTWKSDDEKTVSNAGTVTRPELESKIVKLKATVTKGKTSLEKEFQVRVIKQYKDVVLTEKTEAELKALNNGSLPQVIKSADGSQITINGRYTDYKVETSVEALKSLDSMRTVLGLKDTNISVVTGAAAQVKGLNVYYHLPQQFDGLEVEDREIVVITDVYGNITNVTSNYIKDIKISTVPRTTEKIATKQMLKAQKGRYKVVAKKLFICTDENKTTLAWNFDIKGIGKKTKGKAFQVTVDTTTAKIIKQKAIIIK